MTTVSAVSPRLFSNPVLEFFSRVQPWMPILLWGPIVGGFFALGGSEFLGTNRTIALAISGIFVWSLTEYGLHRFLFHWRPQNPLLSRFVFLMHGIHHEYPNDPDRLLMPPAAAILFAAIFGAIFRLLLGGHLFPTFFAGFLAGYLVYDYVHFASHYSYLFGRLFPGQTRRHMVHHFVDPNRAFGVSSPLWDRVFRT